MSGRASVSALRIVSVFPDLLGTYGDGGNAVVLERRLAWRGMPVEVVAVGAGEAVPEHGDVYLLGGGEDGPQAEAAKALGRQGVLARAVERGAAVLAVCAGFQILGAEFPGADGAPRPGLGLLDVTTIRTAAPRAVGEVVAEAALDLRAGAISEPGGADTGRAEPGGGRRGKTSPALLTGYENHAGRTRLGEGVAALGRVRVGVGNGAGDGSEGAVCGRVIGTYLHGPVLARNPFLGDYLLSLVAGPLPPLEDDLVEQLRAERLLAAGLTPGAIGRRRLLGRGRWLRPRGGGLRGGRTGAAAGA